MAPTLNFTGDRARQSTAPFNDKVRILGSWGVHRIPLGPLACPATTHGVEITWSCTLKVIYVENDEECVQNGGRVVQMQTSAWKAELYMYCLGHIPVRASGGGSWWR
jgi:hypothetical protein